MLYPSRLFLRFKSSYQVFLFLCSPPVDLSKENILMAFWAEPEYDKFGIANAVTMAAQKEESWEKSVELEKFGGHLISLPIEEFKSLDG